ncbi:MAG TPA: sulfotransferase [Acidimicrobiales bacterium]
MTPYPSAESLTADAVEQTGLSDFGPGDFRDGLDAQLASLATDGDLSEEGAKVPIDAFRRRLVNRLQLEAWYAEHPEIEALEVRGPVDINGLPRTGTTALANMLSLDPQFRCLRQWEQLQPCPPPVLGEEESDPRRAAHLREIEGHSAELKAMHIFDNEATSEDTEVLGMAFHGQQAILPVFGYQAWWRHCDMVSTYEYHRRVVKLLQSRRPPNQWLFKAPHHNFHLEAIVAAYPDARFVMTHRDPVKAVPSWVSICSALLPEAEGERDLHRLGQALGEHLREGVEQAMAARSRLGDDRFLDIHHRRMIADPIGTVASIYDFLDLELTPAVELAIAEWSERNRSGAHGTHRYTAEQFGLTDAQLRSDFEAYTSHYDVELEV